MNVAFITPTGLLPKYGCSSAYHLILANICDRDQAYADFYRQRAREGDTVILDNGAYELGASVSVPMLRRWADYIQPSYVVLPDIRNEGERTIENAKRDAEALKDGWKLMAVPQAPLETEPGALEAWFDALVALQELDFVAAIGIYPETELFFPGVGRPGLLRMIEERGLVKSGITYHLLGMSPNPKELMECSKFDWVQGADSAKPIVYGLHGVALHPSRGAMVQYPHRPKGYFTIKDDPFPMIIRYNIDVVRSWASGREHCSWTEWLGSVAG